MYVYIAVQLIMNVAKNAAMTEKWGGGIGFGFSKLRPEGDPISTVHGIACGPIAVMKLYSKIGETLTQGSFRLGAHMGQLHISHPDVMKFITCKVGSQELSNFNISVQIPDDFMEAVLLDTQQNQPEAYRLAEMMYPHMFAQPEDESKDKPSKGLIPDDAIPEGRISNKKRKGIVDTLYKTIRPDAEEELERYARDEGSSTNIKDAMAHMQQWLEENGVGGPDSAAAILTRGEVITKEMKHLRRNWGTIRQILKEKNIGLFIRETTAKLHVR